MIPRIFTTLQPPVPDLSELHSQWMAGMFAESGTITGTINCNDIRL